MHDSPKTRIHETCFDCILAYIIDSSIAWVKCHVLTSLQTGVLPERLRNRQIDIPKAGSTVLIQDDDERAQTQSCSGWEFWLYHELTCHHRSQLCMAYSLARSISSSSPGSLLHSGKASACTCLERSVVRGKYSSMSPAPDPLVTCAKSRQCCVRRSDCRCCDGQSRATDHW